VIGMNCAGDNQDTDAYRFGSIGELASGRTAIMVGVDQSAVQAASYMSLSFYDATVFSGFASLVQTNAQATGFLQGTLRGSAEATLKALGLYPLASPRLRAKLPELYVAMLSRQCPVALGSCLQLDPDKVSLDTPINVIQRAYLQPGATTGASPNGMVTPVLIH